MITQERFSKSLKCRPMVGSAVGTIVENFGLWWLWVPAFAGTTDNKSAHSRGRAGRGSSLSSRRCRLTPRPVQWPLFDREHGDESDGEKRRGGNEHPAECRGEVL